jgi:phosphoadenosine phosphosulfate reductase
MTFLEKVEDAKQLIKESIEKYPKIVCACSFGKDSMVMLHLAITVKKNIPVIAVLSDTEFPETYEYAKKMVAKYHLNYKEYRYKQIGTGALCCGAPKVETFKIALADYDAWISGVRSTEGITRVHFKKVETLEGLTKINPILDFTELDVWRYLALYEIPANPKYRDGYRSLSCARCSTPERDENETERAGRWKGTIKEGGECGIHTTPLRK